ncbi:uncharacterized protein [Blastocystis hominis]|uniref:Transcription factor Tfb2 C-terminal domain-containing protein n=1 Tax=Blastocystis hominis TaxID=12968 RepID=D8M4S8_BLAHO|nr:uncharacterized protein [Blastocystis hominis]CBK23067.2 unnamed protein product [Blastocystis hominis]|eukprot:XP_012897115.1 uncharacterized protein [Blastocystis hominis]
MNRASYQRAFLYRDLDMNTFGRIDDAKEIKPFVLYKDNQTKMIVVSAEGKERIQRMRF